MINISTATAKNVIIAKRFITIRFNVLTSKDAENGKRLHWVVKMNKMGIG